MKITSLVENQTNCGLQTAHGLSLYIETDNHHIIFDLGPDDTLFHNAQTLHIDLTAVDTVILSHGHYDHGGALAQFLEQNHHAKVYVQRTAFLPHYSIHGDSAVPIGIDPTLEHHPQMVLLDGDCEIDRELKLFTVAKDTLCHSPFNDCLLDGQGVDGFGHEQHLFIHGDKRVLLFGCGHIGVVNIMNTVAEWKPDFAMGGFHLYSPRTGKSASPELLNQIADHLKNHPTQFYTCHCTGAEVCQYLKSRRLDISYFSCGQQLSTDVGASIDGIL